MVATAQPMTLTRTRLREDFVRPFPARGEIDAAGGVIKGVRIQGFKSRNRRHYPTDTLRDALPLYEGAFVYFRPHTKKPTDSYDPNDKIGWVENVRLTESGVYGDLHLLLSHERTARVLEAAEKNPRLYALSHDADGDLSSPGADGYRVVRRIDAVFALDLVDRGGSNDSLFEDFDPMTTTLRKLIEADGRFDTALRKRILEGADPLDQEIPMPADPAAATGTPAPAAEEPKDWKEYLGMAIAALMKHEDPAAHGIMEKLLGILKPEGDQSPIPGSDHGKEPPAAEPPVPPAAKKDEDDDEEITEECDPVTMKEELETLRADKARLTEELERAGLKDWIRAECDRHKIPAGARLVERLALMRDKAAITAHLQEDFKGARSGKPQAGPRSSGNPAPARDAATAKKPSQMDGKEFITTLNGRV